VELMADGIPTTVICEHMGEPDAAGKIKAVWWARTDCGQRRRSTRSHVQRAILAREHGSVLRGAPWSTIDMATKTGDAIPMRSVRR